MTVRQIKEAIRYLVLAVVIGAATSAVANLFIQGEIIFELLGNFFASQFSVQFLKSAFWMQAIALFVGAALILQIRRVFGVTHWSGPAESMFALQYRAGPPLNTRIGTGSVLAAFIALQQRSTRGAIRTGHSSWRDSESELERANSYSSAP